VYTDWIDIEKNILCDPSILGGRVV